MAVAPSLNRRQFIKAGVAAGGGLLIAFHLRGFALAEKAAAGPFAPNAFIRISPANRVTLFVGRSEMGQGVMTSMPMILADELDADFRLVTVEQAPAEPAYGNPLNHRNATGGSTSVRSSWYQLREAGAAARMMLVAAAAKKWGVKESECRTAQSTVIHRGKRLSYGALAAAAAAQPVPPPDDIKAKAPNEFRLIGHPMPRVDIPAKVRGAAIFGIDVKLPGMLQAAVAQCPVFGGKVKSIDDRGTRKIAGVRNVVRIGSGSAVAVVADHFWSAKQGRDALKVEWDYGALKDLDSAKITREFIAAAKQPGAIGRNTGDAQKALAGAAKRLEAVYQVPYLAHATMEPMNCTAHVRADRCDIYAPTQAQTDSQEAAAAITGLRPDQVNIVTTFLGGGFGRRSQTDFVVQAVEISKAVGAPVKVIWTREDDIQHDFYRPAAYNRMQAALDDGGNPVAWSHRIVAPSIMGQIENRRAGRPLDPSAVEGAAELSYDIPNILVEHVISDPGVPIWSWRSVGHSYTAFAVESFVDELAHAAGQDPYEFRMKLLAKSPRHRAVLKIAAEKAGWGKPPPQGVFRGIAVHKSFGSWVAQVAEVMVEPKGAVKVERVVCAVDCVTIVNPDTIRAQMESGIVYGLSAALMGEITLKNGRVMQSNFDNYPVLRINRMPRVEVYPIAGGGKDLGGIGEPGTPPIAPAVANAIFAATGRRIRTLPIRAADLGRG